MYVILGIILFLLALVILGLMYKINEINKNLNYELKIRNAIKKHRKLKKRMESEYNSKAYIKEKDRIEDFSILCRENYIVMELENMLEENKWDTKA